MKKITVIGCGWLGLPWAKELVRLGYNVKGTTTSNEKISLLENAGIQAFLLQEESNKWNEEILKEVIQSEIIYVFIPPGTRKSNPSNHDQLIQQLITCIKEKKLFPEIIYTSTTSVYPEDKGVCKETDVLSEHTSANPVVYRAEQNIKNSNLNYLILRLGGLTGGSRMLAKYFSGKSNLSSANVPINMVHLEDVLGVFQFFLSVITHKEIYNICSPLHPSKKDFYTHLCKQFNLELPQYNAADENARNKIIDVSKLLEKGYTFKFTDPMYYTYEY
jgi:nucleoside-diphosphate-sugar epimerase